MRRIVIHADVPESLFVIYSDSKSRMLGDKLILPTFYIDASRNSDATKSITDVLITADQQAEKEAQIKDATGEVNDPDNFSTVEND